MLCYAMLCYTILYYTIPFTGIHRKPGGAKWHAASRARGAVGVLVAELGLGFRVWGLGFRVWGLGFRVSWFLGSGAGVWGFGV